MITTLNFVTLLVAVKGFNLDYEYTVVKNGPKNTLFGFSVTEHEYGTDKWILVGAPRANNTFLQSEDEVPGTVFKCNATSPSLTCEGEVPFDSTPSSEKDSKSNQWLGVSLKSGGKENYVVSCAHRYEFYGESKSFRLLTGSCFLVDDSLTSNGLVYQPCKEKSKSTAVSPSHEYHGQCEIGIGLNIQAKSQRSYGYETGAVGSIWFTGSLFLYDDEDDSKEAPITKSAPYQDSYFGYSVASGKFTSKKTEIAVGGPRHRSHGKVIIYKDTLSNNVETSVIQYIPEKDSEYTDGDIQIASGFGIALCAINFDGDEYDELVVGAPFYSNDRKSPDTGMVYVYKKGKNTLKLDKKLTGEGKYNNFGYAVANGGDLNLDGYEDLIVGAPHAGNGKGAVYVYQGSTKGIVEKVAQKIAAENVESGLNADPLGLEGFGRSLAAGRDLDNNGYKDILVGSYISSQAVLLRSRPIVIPKSSMEFFPAEIDTSKKECVMGGTKTVCFNMTFCHNITEPNKLSTTKSVKIQYKLIADTAVRRKRVMFSDGSFEKVFTVTSELQKKCEKNIKLYLKFNQDNTIAEYPDVKFKIVYENINDKPSKDPSKITNLDQYPVLSSMSSEGGVGHAMFSQFAFKRECTKCIPDLSIFTSSKNYTVRLGSKEFLLNVTIENKGSDPAYSVKLLVKLPNSITIDNKILESNCELGKCDNLIPKLGSGEKKEFTVYLNTEEFRPSSLSSQNNITLEVSSANKENDATMVNNKFEIYFEFKVVADIQMLAGRVTQNVAYQGSIIGESAVNNLDTAGQIVEHRFAVRNNGPDLLPLSNVTISWPYETLSGKHLLYLYDVILSSPKVLCTLPEMDVLKLDPKKRRKEKGPFEGGSSSDDNTLQRSRREVDVGESNTNTTMTTGDNKIKTTAPKENREKSGIVLDCRKNTAKCLRMTCQVNNLESGKAEMISVRSRLWETSLLLDYFGEVLSIVSYGEAELGTNETYITDPNPDNNANELFTIINPVKIKRKEKIAVWIIALAVAAGVILLLLLIFALFKLGFFKRNRAITRSSSTKKENESLMRR